MQKNSKFKQIMAIAAIVLLVGIYVASLILAVIKNDIATRMLQASLICTIAIPILIYIIMMFYKLTHRKDDDTDSDEK